MFFIIICATIDLSQAQFETYLRKMSESEGLSSPDDLTIKTFLNQRDQFSELVDEKRSAATIFDLDIWKDAYRETPNDHCNTYKTMLKSSLAAHGKNLPNQAAPKQNFRNFQNDQDFDIENLTENECVLEINRLQGMGPGYKNRRSNLRKKLNKQFGWTPNDFEKNFQNPTKKNSNYKNQKKSQPTQSWGKKSPARKKNFNNVESKSENEDSQIPERPNADEI